MPNDPWRAYLRDHATLLYRQRLQSQAFVRGESLSVLPLLHNSKILAPAANQQFADWADLDYPPPINWAAKFPPRGKTSLGCDIDIDVKPLGGDAAWTPEYEQGAGLIAKMVINGLKAMGLDCRHHWGRASQQGWGHVYFPVAASTKDEINRLLSLTMKRPITLGPYRVRIEVRISNGTNKPITLPGSVYPARSGDGYDALLWQINPEHIGPDFAFPTLQPEPIAKLVKGLYCGLLAVIMAPYWGEGSRHDMALQVAGVLAREAFDQTPILDDKDACTIMEYLCSAFNDHDRKDRLKALTDTLTAAETGKQVTGYTRLGESIGDDAKAALIRLRGGADPDRLAALLEQVAYVDYAKGQGSVFLDLSTKGHGGGVICTRDAIVQHFQTDPRYPAIIYGKKEMPLIEIVLKSNKRQQYRSGIDLPGIPFGRLMIKDVHGYREATETEQATPRELHINIGTGFATAIPDAPDHRAWERFWHLWRRHLTPLTCGNAVQIAKLEHAIAWAVQHPLEKVPLGLLLIGDGGIGKTALFDAILPPIIGQDLFAKANLANLDTAYRVGDLEGKKFYIFEEIDLTHADNSLREFLKDLMKNTSLRVNPKYGREGMVNNYSIPIFLTNTENPGLVGRGLRERSLAVIQGHTQNNLNLTANEWQEHKNVISTHIKEFIAALRDPDIREAAMFYFGHHLDVEREDFEDNTDVGDVVDRRENLQPLEEALCAMIEQNAIHPKLNGDRIAHVPLTAPFKLDMLVDGLGEHVRNRGASKYNATKHNVSKLLKRLLGDECFASHPFFHEGKTRRVSYFKVRPGDMIAMVQDKLGVILDPEYEVTSDDYGPNAPPSAEQCSAAWKLDLSQFGKY